MVISEEVEEDTLTSTLNNISIVRKKSSRKGQALTRKQKLRNAEVHNGSTCREDNSMSPIEVTGVNICTIASVLTKGNSITQPLEVQKVSEITKTSFLNLLKKFWVFFFEKLVNTTQKCMSVRIRKFPRMGLSASAWG